MSSSAKKTEFDRFARDYDDMVARSIRASGFPATHFTERKIHEIRETLRTAGVVERPLRILNFGCGIGKSEPYLEQSFPRAMITSLDVSGESIAVARENNRDLTRVRFDVFDGRHVSYPAGFDIIMLAGVLHHIKPDDRPAVARELHRLLADDGFLFIFEHNPLNPLTRRAVMDCPFDEDADLVPPRASLSLLTAAGFGNCAVRFIHFFPKAFRILIPLERRMRRIPLGAQYYCLARKRKQST